ncbi:hypothetical protein SAMN04488029_0487 [Reichenbachiella faecimaris]|uniref:Uncharacterized protein n=1 Tax=Reichenbachiella faecimaris TaxID=692418 RepID=A0A1W2G768_REIFA|nr:hypothetical protein [Reichenbachiella faecimaris]SMD32146.1 hypothetical protein SAMN04488029_0487 [Reichenbachiella faecimaris]
MKVLTKYWNKISTGTISLIIVLSSLLYTCQEPDPFPTTPHIEFNNLEYVEIEENGVADSLILYFDFEDGDGDLGLPSDDNYYPVHDYYIIADENTNPITISSTLPTDQYLLTPGYFKNAARAIGQNEYFRPFGDPYSAMPDYECEYFESVYINEELKDIIELADIGSEIPTGYVLDTVLVYRNPNRYNFYIDFFRKRGTEYEVLNISRPDENGCIIPFNGRFPLLDVENIGGSLEGTIKYSMPSLGFRVTIRNDEFKLRFHILDHHFNKSNIVETGDVTLDQLIR